MEGTANQASPSFQGGIDVNRLLFEHTIEVDAHSSLKNSKIISYFGGRRNSATSRPFLRTKPKAKAAQEFLVLALQERARRILLDRPISRPVFALWTLELASYYTKGKPKRLNRKAGDLSNLIQGPEDALMKAGILEDDALIVMMTAAKMPSSDGKNRIKIQLFRAE